MSLRRCDTCKKTYGTLVEGPTCINCLLKRYEKVSYA
jgi:hypothetical protein